MHEDETLRHQIAKALYEEGAWPDRDWHELPDSRRVGWLEDADRIIPIVQRWQRDELGSQRLAQLEGLAIGLEQRGEKSAAHIIRTAIKSLCWCGDVRVMGEKVCAKHESDLVGKPYSAPATCAHPVERLWRKVGLPEYFLGNGGSNEKLYALYDEILQEVALTPRIGT